MSRFNKTKLALKMGIVAVPLAFLGFLISVVAVSAYKDRQPSRVVSAVTQNGLTAILGESTIYSPTEGYTMPTTCPAPYTGTPPNCQPPADSTYTAPTAPTDTTYPSGSTPTYTSPSPGSSTDSTTSSGSSGSGTSTYTMPTTCPSGYSGTPPNCQPAAGTSQPSGGSTGTNTTPNTGGAEQYQGSTDSSSQSGGSQYVAPPPTFTKSDSGNCMERLLGAEAYAQFQAGGFHPTGDQIAKAQSCFSAQVSYSGSSGNQGPGRQGGTSGPSGNQGSQPLFANIPIAPPPAFQADSPALACAKSIMGDRFGSPVPELISQVQSRCFATATSGQQIGFIDPNNQAGRGGPLPGVALSSQNPGDKPGAPPQLPSEVKACIIKAGMSEATIAAISRGQSPTAAQQQQGESCFSQYAKDRGYTPPMLTPPDPTQPFDPNSKQNQCADLVAQTHGIRVSQINPGIVTSWNADDIGKLRSCYGVSPASSAGNNTMAFAPTSPQVAISSSKLSCIETAVGGDKLAAVMAGTANMSQNDRKAVYDKCINPTKIASDPALLGILAAMPPSDLESQFIPIDSQILPAPTAAGTSQSSADAEVAIGGEVNVAAGTALPTKVDVFVKSTSQTFTVALKNVSATKAVWTMNLGQNKLALGDHKAYAVATLGDATQTRSPDASFAITAAKAAKSNTKVIIGASTAAVALVVGAWLGWRWHKGKGLPSLKLWHKKPKYTQ
ncbi:hypothetical protein HYS84_03260 [Candidatus Saccharibacteria bacterium]|nr:hypothetical protein [Candidatus Saccharibacteria bacterium]